MRNLALDLGCFLRLVLRLVPAVLWWALAGLAFFTLNGLFIRELWPHTPQAGEYLILLGGCYFLVVLWTVVHLLQLLSRTLTSAFWRVVYFSIWGLSAATAVLLTFLVSVFCYYCLFQAKF